MKTALVLSLLAVFSTAAEQTRWNLPSREGVSVLSDNNFNDVITKHPYVFVMFTSPNCPHCNSAHPEMAKLAKNFDSQDKEAVVAEVDVVDSPAIANKYDVSAFPSYKLFFHGIPIDYKMGRSEKHLAAWLIHRIKERANEITKLEAYQKVSDFKVAAVLYLSKKNKKVLNNFQALAATHVRVPFFYTYLDEVQTDLGVTGDFALGVFRKFDDGRKVLSTNDLSYDTMFQFLENVRMPALPELSEDTGADIFGQKKTTVILFTDSEETDAFKEVQKLAKTKKHSLLFTWTNLKSTFAKKIAELMGVTDDHKDQLRLLNFGENDLEKFKLEQITEESLKKFISDFEAGKLPRYQKSSDAKTDSHRAGRIWEVTGDDFEKLVLSSPKNVLLNVYSHNCKHCEETHKVLEKLATHLKDHPDVVVAQFNGFTNEHPALNIHAYPTIKLFKKGRKSEPVDFRGTRNLRNLTEFLKRELGSQWKNDLVIDDESL
jgi:protein disulfide-isomerase A1